MCAGGVAPPRVGRSPTKGAGASLNEDVEEVLLVGHGDGTKTNNNLAVSEKDITKEMTSPIKITRIRETTATPVKNHENDDTGRRKSPRRAKNITKGKEQKDNDQKKVLRNKMMALSESNQQVSVVI